MQDIKKSQQTVVLFSSVIVIFNLWLMPINCASGVDLSEVEMLMSGARSKTDCNYPACIISEKVTIQTLCLLFISYSDVFKAEFSNESS